MISTRPDSAVSLDHLDIAVLIPCHNEAPTIEKVIRDFQRELPRATIYVCDNVSTDNTARLAAAAGAVVMEEASPGKGNAVWRLFADVEADIFVLVDGDDTYDATDVVALITRCVTGRFDMVSGARVPVEPERSRFGHDLGNVTLTRLVGQAFGSRFQDMLSGYRVFSRRFVKSFPVLSRGFEIETELTVHALELRMPVTEMPTQYRPRPAGSVSKLRTYRDGWRILMTIITLLKEERPLPFFSTIGLLFTLLSLALALPVVIEFVETGLVPRLPTAVLAAALMLLAALSLVCGFVLDTVTRGRREAKRLRYLEVRGVGAARAGESA
jgi:glycosyltransferase involved in cell wall biosynthesis